MYVTDYISLVMEMEDRIQYNVDKLEIENTNIYTNTLLSVSMLTFEIYS